MTNIIIGKCFGIFRQRTEFRRRYPYQISLLIGRCRVWKIYMKVVLIILSGILIVDLAAQERKAYTAPDGPMASFWRFSDTTSTSLESIYRCSFLNRSQATLNPDGLRLTKNEDPEWSRWTNKYYYVSPDIKEYPRRFHNVSQVMHKHKHCVDYYNYTVTNLTIFFNLIGIRNVVDEVHNVGLTLCTQLKHDRLHRLEDIANHWPGPISAVIYLRAEHLSSFLVQLKTLTVVKRTNMYLQLAVPPVNTGDHFKYPINTLRNIALRAVSTSHVFYIDVDFVPDSNAYIKLLKHINARETKIAALVVPAFESHYRTFEFPQNKSELKSLFCQNNVTGFHMKLFFNGHGPTNFTKWLNTEKYYTIKYAQNFEPYYVLEKRYLPPYPEEFVGRDFNKVVQCNIVHKLGIPFVVVPDTFIVHLYHPRVSVDSHSKSHKKCAIELYHFILRGQNYIPKSFINSNITFNSYNTGMTIR